MERTLFVTSQRAILRGPKWLRRAVAMVILGSAGFMALFGARLLEAGNFYAGTSPANVPWPGGIVPYEFTNTLSAAQQKAYLDGLREWELAANVRFVAHTNQSRWILFTYNTNGIDNVSAGYNPQVVSVDNLSRAQVCHEMGHSFGFTHENIRVDQTNHILVVTNNIFNEPNNIQLFTIDSSSVTNGPYDFESVMHLGWDFVSLQPGVLPTQQPRPPFAPRYNTRMGNLCLSPGDRAALAYLYGPPTMPLTNVVTNTADVGPGSLRAALYYATDHPGATVRFAIPASDPGYSNGVFTIYLSGHLPPLATNGMIMDGSTQPGFGSVAPGPTPVDILVDFEGGTNGQTVTPAILAAGTHGDGTWTTTVALTNLPLVYGTITNVAGLPLPGPVTVGGSLYLGTNGTRALAMRNERFEETVLTYGATHNKVAVGYWWNPGFGGGSDFNWNDEVAIMSTGWADEWCINSWECAGASSQVVKVHSNAGTGAAINLTGVGTNNAHWYWVSQLYEAGVQSKLAIFDTNLVQIGPTSSLPITNLPAKDIEFGQHHAVSNHPSISLYENAIIAYDARAIFPLIPAKRSGGSLGPSFANEPLIVVDGSQILPDSRNFITGLLIYSASNQVKNISFTGFNWNGLTLTTPDATNNNVAGCWFGLHASGTNAAPNSFQGILIAGGASGNVIGGTNALARNVLSGNKQYGLWISDSNTAGNVILGNYIGTDAAGQKPVPNWLAGLIVVGNTHDNIIGGAIAGSGNVISGNTNAGVWIRGTNSLRNLVQGNQVGLNAAGNSALPNTFVGMYVDSGSRSNQILNNVFSGHVSEGLRITDPGTSDNVAQGNFFGTDVTGSNAIPNSFAGVTILNGATRNTIGGLTAAARNVISGNYYGSVIGDAGTSGNVVEGNLVGLNASGLGTLANSFAGLMISNGATNNLVGGMTVGAGNFISGNGTYGVFITDAGTSRNSILGNVIGADLTSTNSKGNGFANVELQSGASGNFIGSTNAGGGNLIAFSGAGPGVVLFDPGTTNNSIRGNSIFSNAGLGIDLNNDGVTLNDAGDGDSGPNQMQNFPVLTNAYGFGSATVVSGRLNSLANRSFFIDVYGTPAPNPSGYGEGKSWLGAAILTTDGSGNASFAVTNTSGNYAGQYLAATATASPGDTSEFSLAVLATNLPAPPGQLTGPFSLSQTGFTFTVTLSTNFNYRIQAATNIGVIPISWVDLTNLAATNSTFHFTDRAATNYRLRFYRAVSP